MSPDTMPAPDITVILPTRNRAARLPALLDRLADQRTDGRFTYEVVVVDNGSTDATCEAVESRRGRFPAPLRYCHEPQAGKSYALNLGIREARGNWLVLLDDDIIIPPDWLAAFWACAAAEPAAEAITGRVLPQWPAQRPAWLTEDVSRHLNQTGLGCIDHGDRRQRTAEGHDCRWVGGNCAIRRECAARVGGFNTSLIRGQDSEYYEQCVALGLKIVYEPAATVRHEIGPERLTLQAFRQWRHRQGYYEASLLPWRAAHLVTVMPLWRWATTLRAAAAWCAAQVTRRSWWERFYAELKLREQLGAWAYRLQHWPGRGTHG